MKPSKTLFALALAVATGFAAAGTAWSADPSYGSSAPIAPQHKKHFVKVGMLSCINHGGFGYIIGSSKKLSCTFNARRGGPEYYQGSMTRVGPDIGYTHEARILWAVYAPSYQVPNGSLDGTYVGISADAAVGLGLGANVLGGNLDDNINLVPVSVSGSIGLSVFAGVSALTLNSDMASR